MGKSNEEKALERIKELYEKAKKYYEKKGINVSREKEPLVVFAYLAENQEKPQLEALITLLVKSLKERGEKFNTEEFIQQTYNTLHSFFERIYSTEEADEILERLQEKKEKETQKEKQEEKQDKTEKKDKGEKGKKRNGKETQGEGQDKTEGQEKVEKGKKEEIEKKEKKTKGGTTPEAPSKGKKGKKPEIIEIDEPASEEIIKTFFSTENMPKNVAVPKKSLPIPPYIVRFQNDDDFYNAFTEFLKRRRENADIDKTKGIFQKLLHPELRLRKDPPYLPEVPAEVEDAVRGVMREEIGELLTPTEIEAIKISTPTKAEGKFRVWDDLSNSLDIFIKEYENYLTDPEFIEKADINKQIAQKFLNIIEKRVGKNSFPPYSFHYEDIGGGVIRTAVSFTKEFIDLLSQLPEAKLYFTEGILHHFLDTVEIPEGNAIVWLNSTFIKENNELLSIFSNEEIKLRKILNDLITKHGTSFWGKIVSSKEATKPFGILKIIKDEDFPGDIKNVVDEIIEKEIDNLRKINKRQYVRISKELGFTVDENNTIKVSIPPPPSASSSSTDPSSPQPPPDTPTTPSTPGSPPSKPPKKINPRDIPIEILRKIRSPYVLGATGALFALYLLLRKKGEGEKIELPSLELPSAPTTDISFQGIPPITINIDVENTIAKMAEAFRRKAEQKKAQLVKRIEQAYIMTQVQSALFNMYKPETKVSFHESVIISLYAEANKYDEKTKLAMLRGLMYAKQNNIAYTSPEELLAYSHLPITEKSNEAIQAYIDYQNRMAQILQFEFQKDYETYINLTKEATKWRIKAQELQEKINAKIILTNFMLRFKKEVEEAKKRASIPSLEVMVEERQ